MLLLHCHRVSLLLLQERVVGGLRPHGGCQLVRQLALLVELPCLLDTCLLAEVLLVKTAPALHLGEFVQITGDRTLRVERPEVVLVLPHFKPLFVPLVYF